MLTYMRASLAALKSNQVLFDTIAHNVANMNTNGFRRMNVKFVDVIYRQLQPVMEQPPTARNLSGGVVPLEIPRSFERGQFVETGNPLDLALNGEGFFQVQLADGRVGYTRDGGFALDNNGRLVTGAGQPVLPEIRVPEDAAHLYVYPNGAVFASRGPENRPEAWQQIGQVQVATFANPQGLAAVGTNAFVETPASGPPQVGNPGEMVPGEPNASFGEALFATVESSNVNPMVETTTLLMARRAYGLSMRALLALDEMLNRATNLRSS